MVGIYLASTVALVGLVVGLRPDVLTILASHHQKACSDYPVLLGWTQHVVPVMPTVVGFLTLVPLARALWTLLRQVRETARLKQEVLSRSVPLPSKLAAVAEPFGLLNHIVCVQDRGIYAFCLGLWHSRICISTGMVWRLSRSELEAVLLHESCHMQNRDSLRLMVSRVVASGLVWVPIADDLRQRYHLSREFAADRKALTRVPVEVLASALLQVLVGSGTVPRYEFATVGALDVVRERIARLGGNKAQRSVPPLERHSLFASAFVALALLVGTAGFSEASSHWAGQAHDCHPVVVVNTSSPVRVDEGNAVSFKCSHVREEREIPRE